MQKASNMADISVLFFFWGCVSFVNSFGGLLNSIKDNNIFGASIYNMLSVFFCIVKCDEMLIKI